MLLDLTISPESALIAAAVLIGASVRLAILLRQRKQIFSRRNASNEMR
jgi:hypothetical protein